MRFALFTFTLTFSSISAFAGSIFSTGFESPTYTVGNLGSQGGWAEFNPSDSFQTVETGTVNSGLQAVYVGTNQTATAQSGIYHTDTLSGGPLIDLSADLYIFSSTTESGWQFAGTGAVSTLTPFIGGFDLSSTGSLGTSDTIDGITAGFPVLGTFNLNTWNHVDLLFNFTTQTYTLSLNGTVIGSNLAFCGDNGPCTSGIPIAEGQFSSFFDVFASLTSNDLGVIDNVSLSSVSAPEPSTYALTGIALLAGAVVLRRRV
jgi:hypothetical protein